MPYMDSTERSQENRSSAVVLLAIGGAGLALVILGATGVLPFQFANPYIVYGVMAAFFLIFIVMGFVSLKSAKTYAAKAESEKFLENTILEWCRENLDADEINAESEDYQVLQEEEIYFRRAANIRRRIESQFMNLDPNFVERFIDETIYDMVFGEQAK